VARRIPRRIFLGLTIGAFAAPSILWTSKEVPCLLDHILLGCSDLDRGIDFVEQYTGVRAAFGGVHPGRGTRNALLSLGERRYLEIIAPDPAQSGATDTYGLRGLAEPRLVHWAAHPGDLDSFAKRLREAGVVFKGPTPGSRKRPDGRVLNWKTLNLADERGRLLPFFIEWSADSIHPSADSPKGCLLIRFEAVTPELDALKKQADLLGLHLPIIKSEKDQLRAVFAASKGQFTVTT
jgi:catechol 2,3-dioxygenase-like lactoylglutathione lyase family enzyme